jgi:DNA-binding transcriptional MerR regulator
MDSEKKSATNSEPPAKLIMCFSIGGLARRTGTKVQTVRYYEEIGLLPEPERSVGGQRRYDQTSLDRLAFIRHAREMGFSLEMVRELLDLSDAPAHSCEAADAIARRHLDDVNAKLRRLVALKSELERMIEQCRGGRIADCRVIEVLADHRECLTRRHTDPENTAA